MNEDLVLYGGSDGVDFGGADSIGTASVVYLTGALVSQLAVLRRHWHKLSGC